MFTSLNALETILHPMILRMIAQILVQCEEIVEIIIWQIGYSIGI